MPRCDKDPAHGELTPFPAADGAAVRAFTCSGCGDGIVMSFKRDELDVHDGCKDAIAHAAPWMYRVALLSVASYSTLILEWMRSGTTIPPHIFDLSESLYRTARRFAVADGGEDDS